MKYGTVYGIILFIFLCITLIFSKIIKNKKVYLFIFDIFVAIPSFYVHSPSYTSWDIDKYAFILKQIRFYNSNYILDGWQWAYNFSTFSHQPVVVSYLWLGSLFKENGWFYFFTTFIFLSVMSFFIIKVLNQYKLSIQLGLLVQIIILLYFNLFYEIQGVRNFLAFLIFSVAFYVETIAKNRKEKIICWLFYFLACFIHSATIIFLIFRIILLIKNKFFISILCVLIVFYNLFLDQIIEVISNLNIFPTISQKLQFYLYGQSSYDAHAGNFEIVLTTFVLIVLIIEFIFFIISRGTTYLSPLYNYFYTVSILFTIVSFLSMQVYLRSIMLILFLSIPIKIVLYSNLSLGSSLLCRALYKYVVFILAIVAFIGWNLLTYSNVLVY